MFPLSFAQQRLWFFNRLEGPNSTYNVQVVLRMRGTVDVPALEAALADVVTRHESLRTVFGESDGEPYQCVLPENETGVVLKILDSDLDRAEDMVCDGRVHDPSLAEVLNLPFDLDTDLLLRAWLFRAAPDEHVFALVVHHAVFDGWSVTPLLRDLTVAYNARAGGQRPGWEPLPVQYSDYTVWHRELCGSDLDLESLISKQLVYWREALAGIPEELELPADRVRPSVATYRGDTISLQVPGLVHAGLAGIARRTGSTLFIVAQAAVAALLSRLGAGRDIPLGTSVAGRMDESLDELVGCFINTVVLRADLSGEPSFLELVQRVRTTSLAAYDHQELPFERLVEEVNPPRSRSVHPLFQVGVAFHDWDSAAVDLVGLECSVEDVGTDTTKFDLNWDFVESAEDGLTVHLSFATDLFDRETAEQLLRWLAQLLVAFVEEPTVAVGRVPLVGEQAAGASLSASRPAHPDLEVGIVERLRRHAIGQPTAIAVIEDDRPTTYAELVGRSSQVARALIAAGAGPGTVVPVLADRGATVIAGILGIATAGAVYLPLDTSAPLARTTALLAEVGSTLLLADTANVEHARLVADQHDGPLDVMVIHDLTDPLDDLLPERGGADSLAYVIFTSGSTGRPKGAMVDRRGMINNCLGQIEAMGMSDTSVVAATAPLTFDISIWQMFAPLIAGGTVRAVPDDYSRDPSALFWLMAHENIAVLQVVPSMLQAALNEWDTGATEPPELTLRCLATVGEALPADLCLRWAKRFPTIPIVNCYGPTECSDAVTHAVIEAGTLPVNTRTPIGRAAHGSHLHVLDDAMEHVPSGIAGELYVGGVSVGGGYLGDPRRSAAAFVPDPFCAEPGGRMYRTGDVVRYRRDGQLEFLGRRDHQVKVRGRRIELGEIEHAMRAVEGVRGAVAAVAEGPGGQKVLVGYYVGATEPVVLRAALAQVLPEAMVPGVWIPMESLPLTPNGKLDRRALPKPDFAAGAAGRPASTQREKLLCGIFEEVLSASDVGLDDSFFELGGHSLLAIQLIRKVNATFGIENPTMGVCMVFEARTVDELNTVIGRALADRGLDPEQWETEELAAISATAKTGGR